MTHPAGKKSEHAGDLPKPIVTRPRWPLALIWVVPVIAAGLAGYYFYERAETRGPKVTVRFADATGLKPGETPVVHLGVQIGQVETVRLDPDKKRVQVVIRLHRSESAFAKKGAVYWIVRPEISAQEISGLATVLSGPIIDSNPGSGETQSEFTGLDKPPTPQPPGLRVVLKTPRFERLQPSSPVYYRGIQVGYVQEVHLSSDSTTVEIHTLIQPRYAPLVRRGSQFWAVPAVDLKGSVFTGIQMKVESLRSLLSGGIAFATPEEKMGDQAQDGDAFDLHDESKKDWLAWVPKISIEADDDAKGEQNPTPPGASQTLRSTVGSN